MVHKILISPMKTPAGLLILGSYGEYLCLCDWKYRRMRDRIDRRLQSLLNTVYCEGRSPVIDAAEDQLSRYFQGRLKRFDLPLLLPGTDFQKKVWNELMNVPYGAVSTYRELSEKTGKREAVRAVAAANGANAVSIIVPCHRVIGVNGELVGYAGGLDAKKYLLNLECRTILQPELFL